LANGPRVLIVEDQPDARETLSMLLGLSGYGVRSAGDGIQGLRLAQSWHPDVIISDIGLPGMDGWQFARKVRATLGPDVQLIALSAYTTTADQTRSREAGFDVHLAKPAEPRDLLALLPPVRKRVGAGV